MSESGFSVVTGAFGYTGHYIAELLLNRGEQVKTLTNHPNRTNPFGDRISVAPFSFDNPSALVESLRGANVLYNTYWARFSYGEMTYDKAVRNSRTLINAAKEAGVTKIVQVTVTKASEDSTIPYFKGKGQVERAVIESGLPYTILRPCMVFGSEGILINDIAWLLRRLPIFAVPGDGQYKVSSIFVKDMAELAVSAGQHQQNEIIDAIGPETYTFNDLLRLIASAIRSRTVIIHTNPKLALFLAGMAGKMVGDIILEQWEIDAMFQGLLHSDNPPTGHTKLSEWVNENAEWLGKTYFSELSRNYSKR